MKCIICEQDIGDNDKKILLPIEVPYYNLVIHRVCRDIEKSKLMIILNERLEKYIKISNNNKKR